jgi:DtxR family Mn-dependent transcriptional regulator
MVDINMGEKTFVPLSESVQTYLVTIARLRVDSRPVPLSQLAQSLSISPVSVNEMCRKLQDQGLLIYQPYKGASLTPEGERRAYYILRRHRLWEVFLVEKLGFASDQAHDAACQLEHTTPDLVADRLDIFLGHPTVNPEGEPIPGAAGKLPARFLYPLTALSAGQRGHVIRCDVSEAAQVFLDEQGVRAGASVTVMATAEDSLLLQVGEAHISLARAVAEAIQVEPAQEKDEVTPLESTTNTKKEETKMEPKEAAATQIPLHKLGVGQRGVVVRVGGKGPARRRMMDMGLVPGSEVKVVRVAPLGDPVEFELKGYSLSLRKSEARDITVEVPAEEVG